MNKHSSLGPRTSLPAWRASQAVLIAILVICVTGEAALQGADFGLWGSPRWRGLAYQNAGFWRGLLDTWRPDYAAQPTLMCATYGFLHVGALREDVESRRGER